VVPVSAGEDGGVDARVERLDAAAEHLGRLGERVDVLDSEPELLEIGGRSPARDEIPLELGEATSEELEAGFVVGRDQRAHSSLTTFGSNRCSTACTRARSDSTVSWGSTGTRSAAITGPVSMPSSTSCTVAAVSAAPAASTSSVGWAPGKSRWGA